MSLTISPASATARHRRRRPRHQQIPSIDVTEGRVNPTACPTKPPRRVGKGGQTYAERRQVSDELIEEMDLAGEPRWRIAAASRLSERQVYRRLEKIREARLVRCEVRRMLDDLAIPG